MAAEIRNCATYLAEELHELCGEHPRRLRVVLCLGRLAHEAVVRTLSARLAAGKSEVRGSKLELPAFAHGQVAEVWPRVHLLDSYHPSRQNTNTGRLTEKMLDQVMLTARQLLDA